MMFYGILWQMSAFVYDWVCYFVCFFFSFKLFDDGEGEVYGSSEAAAGRDVSVNYYAVFAGLGTVFGDDFHEGWVGCGFFVFEKAESWEYAWGSADGGDFFAFDGKSDLVSKVSGLTFSN